MPRPRLAPLSCLLLAATAVAAAEPHPVRAELLAGPTAADGSVDLGVRLVLEPGWHVYWRHPGDAGLATAVRLELPEGWWSAGEIHWPLPERFVQPGGIEGYGWDGEVVLLIPVRAPAGAAEGDVSARVSWLACRDRCILGDARPRLRLPRAAPEADAAAGTLERWRQRLPRAASQLPARTTVGGVLPERGEGELSLWLHWNEPPGAVTYFPAPDETLQVRSVRTATRGATTRVDLVVARQGTGPAAGRLDGVVVREADGRRTGYALPFDLPEP